MNVVFFITTVLTVGTLFFSLTSSAQTLYLIGGALKTCSSMATKNCAENVEFSAAVKTHLLFSVDERAINKFTKGWPTNNRAHLRRTLKLLKKLPSNKVLSKLQLAQHAKQFDEGLYRSWSDKEYNFFFDMLELPLLYQHNRIPEIVNTNGNNEPASTEIIEDIIKRIGKTKTKRLLLVTASSRDPYESADFYEGLFQSYDVNAQWFPLTPALAAALSRDDCENLDSYRNQLNGVYNREVIYPDRTLTEYNLCQQGIEKVKQQLVNADAVMFNGGDQSLTKLVMYATDKQTPYPWTEVLKEIPIIIGTSAGTAVQAGGKNAFGYVPMITNGSSIEAILNGAINASAPVQHCEKHGGCGKLNADALTYDATGGLGVFSFGVLDTHFSERGRSFRLAVLALKSGQKFGFGVDETTALKFESTEEEFSVLGKQGVVVIETHKPQHFYYSFYPAGSTFSMPKLHSKNKSNSNVVNKAKGKRLVENLVEDNSLREVTQLMCLEQLSEVEASQVDLPNIHIERTNQSRCDRLVNGKFRVKNITVKWHEK